jgi:hypothetical protein
MTDQEFVDGAPLAVPSRQTFTIIGEFHGAQFNGTYTTQEVVDRINADSDAFTAALVDDGTVKAIPRVNQTASTISIVCSRAYATGRKLTPAKRAAWTRLLRFNVRTLRERHRMRCLHWIDENGHDCGPVGRM